MNPAPSLILDLAVRMGLLTPAQVQACRLEIESLADPIGGLVGRGLLAADEANLLRAKLDLVQTGERAVDALVEKGTISPQDARKIRDHQMASIAAGTEVSLTEAARELRIALPEEAPSRVGPYRILHELGRGGMGVVYAARDERLGRDVAMKVLRGGFEESAFRRFEREARLCAALDHPRIVGVFDVGRHNGAPYFVMPLVEGRGLDAARLPRRQALAVLQTVAEAIHHAHERGVIHRDLKPSNILVDMRGEGYVTDFGLAKQVGTDQTVTVSGEIFGTPGFMSPEQARADAAHVDRRSDVWGLGATLYFILTGRPPFAGGSFLDILGKVKDQDPAWPRSIDPSIHPDLEAICLRALEKDPERRYPTARAMAEDIGRFLNGEPIEARPPSRTYRMRRWLARHRGMAVAAGLILVAGVGIAWGWSLRKKATAFREAKEAAVSASRSGEWRRALIEAERALALEKDDEMEAIVRRSRDRLAREEAEARRYRWLQDRLRPVEELIQTTAPYFYVAGDEIYGRLARVREALGGLEPLASDPEVSTYPELWRTLGIGWHQVGEEKKAEAALRRAWDLGDRKGWTGFYLAKSLLGQMIGRGGAGSIIIDGKTVSFLRWVDKKEFLAKGRGRAEEAHEILRRTMSGWWDAREIDLHIATGYLLLAKRDRVGLFKHCRDGIERFGNTSGIEEFWFLSGVWKGGEEAVHDLTHALRRKPHFPMAYLIRGNSLPISRWSDRIKDCDRALRIHPKMALAYAARASANAEGKKLKEALEDIGRAIRLSPDLFALHHTQGVIREACGDLPGAIASFTAALEWAPRFAPAFYMRGRMRERTGDRAGALTDYSKAIDLDRDYVSPYRFRASLRWKRGRFAGAVLDATEVIRLDPKNPMAYKNRGTYRSSLRQWKEAIADFDEAIKLDSKLAGAYHGRGEARREIGDLPGSLADCTRAIELKPKYAAAYNNRANTYWRLERYRDALADWTKAIEIDRKFDLAWYNRGGAYFSLARFEKAERDFTEALRHNPGYADAYRGRAFVREYRKNWRGAEEDYRSALARAPKNWPYRKEIRSKLAAVVARRKTP